MNKNKERMHVFLVALGTRCGLIICNICKLNTFINTHKHHSDITLLNCIMQFVSCFLLLL